MTDPHHQTDPLFLSFQSNLVGRYSIDRELGRGGMGVVYLAREVQLDRLVAIKLLPPELAAQTALRDRFLREAQLAAKLSHPNIIPIHAVEQSGAFVYFVMAYVDGETLGQRVQSRGPLSATDGIRILREVAWALAYAHGQGLVHRDVKPDNILIEAGSGRALVADFGIAAAAGDTMGDGVSGTPEFMSPEQALGTEVDARSDLYSLGATAFYALSGRLPFEGKTSTEVLARQVAAPAPSLATSSTRVPRKLVQLVDRCLAKEPTARPANAQSLADSLGLAVEQRRELPAALRAFVKRNGRLDGGGTILSLLGALVVCVGASVVAGPTGGVLALGASFGVIPVVFSIVAARRLLNLGFTQADLAPAYRAEQESSREERGVHTRSRWSLRNALERGLSKLARVAGATGVVLVPFTLATIDTTRFSLMSAVIVTLFGLSAIATLGFLVMMQTRRDVDVEFWNAVWTGRFGTFAFSVARRLRGAKPMQAAMTHRATELSLGMAAEQLFESLPKASRDSLGDLPALLQKLQRDANLLRRQHDALQDVLAQDSDGPESEHSIAVRSERDMVRDRMRDTVGAMETLRLGLLRLHAGSLSLESLTTHIALAANASADVERLLAAHAEVDAVLRVPRSNELTPV
jgi:eukaryotic-like serine/threonine-protein kinase